MQVKPKKHLGQHFLNNEAICQRIAEIFEFHEGNKNVLEIGPGMGALTTHLLDQKDLNLKVMELDRESIAYLTSEFDKLDNKNILEGDFLKQDLKSFFNGEVAVVGNFPYNISSQILFKVFENKELVPEVIGMFQKEVAERICSNPGSKKYGILSVLLQAFYQCDYVFTVDETEFTPAPRVKSGVIHLKRNEEQDIGITPEALKKVVKLAFNQRRKTLRNSVKSMILENNIDSSDVIFNQRPEQLSWQEFVKLVKILKAN